MAGHVTTDVLPNDVLLEILDWCLDEALQVEWLDAWYELVHVSREWRCVVFDSPRRLNLPLLCSSRRPVREMLTIWPPSPIVVWGYDLSAGKEDDIIAALEHHDRVREIVLTGVPSSLQEKLLAATQGLSLALTILVIETEEDTALIIPDSLLGGFAPNLKTLWLTRIPIPFPV